MIGEILARYPWLGTLAWQSTVCLAAGLGGSWLVRRRAVRAHQILFLGLLAAALIPVLSQIVRLNRWGLFAAERAVPEPVHRLGAAQDDLATSAPPAVDPPAEAPGVRESPKAVPASVTRGFAWAPAVMLLWLAAGSVLLARLGSQFLLGRRVLKRSEPLDELWIRPVVQAGRDRLAIRADVTVRATSHVRSPIIWCWGRQPTLLIPKALRGNGDGLDWASIIFHELAHWKRGDHLSGLVAELMVCLLPWQPLAWRARRRLVALSEEACDDWVIASGQGAARYAKTLLGLVPQGGAALVPGVVTTAAALATRVRRIIEDRCGNPRAGVRWSLAAVALAGSIALGVGFAQTQPAPLSPTDAGQPAAREQLHKILDAMAYHDRAVMPIALHTEIELFDLDAPAESQHNQTYVFEQRLDGKRLDCLMAVNRLRNGAWRCEQVNRRVFTGEKFLYRQQQTVGPGPNPLTAVLYPQEEATRVMAFDHLWGCTLFGYLAGDERPVAAILRDAADVVLRDRLEEVDGFACHVIEGKTRYGRYRLWIDPQHDFRMRRAIIDRGAGDLYYGRPLAPDTPRAVHEEISDVKLERIGARFITTTETVTTAGRTDAGKEYHARLVVKRSRIDLHPDFEKLGAFVMDGIPEGTRLTNWDLNDHTYAYEWHNGRAVSVAPDGGTIVGRFTLPGGEDLGTVLSATRSLRAIFTPASAPGREAREKSRHTMAIAPGKDGTFRVEDIPPGIYFLHLVLTETVPAKDSSGRMMLLNKTKAEIDREFSIPESQDPAQKIVDLGVIEMRP